MLKIITWSLDLRPTFWLRSRTTACQSYQLLVCSDTRIQTYSTALFRRYPSNRARRISYFVLESQHKKLPFTLACLRYAFTKFNKACSPAGSLLRFLSYSIVKWKIIEVCDYNFILWKFSCVANLISLFALIFFIIEHNHLLSCGKSFDKFNFPTHFFKR